MPNKESIDEHETIKSLLDTDAQDEPQIINIIATHISQLFSEAPKHTFKPKNDDHKQRTPLSKRNKPWFGTRCRNKRLLYHMTSLVFELI